MLPATCNGDLFLLKYLVKHDIDIYHKDRSGVNPLMLACTNGSLQIVKYLLENHNFNINDTTIRGTR